MVDQLKKSQIYGIPHSKLTCRSLNVVIIKRFIFLRAIIASSWDVWALWSICFQIWLLTPTCSSWYFNMRWILLRITSSKLRTWLMVRNMISLQYFSLWRNIEINLLQLTFFIERCFKYTSASFRRMRAF